MVALQASDFISIYAAFLSTMLAVASLVRWILKRPRLSVTVFGPHELKQSGREKFLVIISNVGEISSVIQSIEISFRTSRWIWSKEVAQATFGERSSWKPSVKLAAIDGTGERFHEEPNILHPGEEIRQRLYPVTLYESDRHWIRVAALARNSRKRFVGWAEPKAHDPSKDIQP